METPKIDKPTAVVRLTWIDLIRGGGAFLVVLAHIVVYPQLMGARPLWAQTLYYTISRVAVPLFFMASGFLLLPKQEPLSVFYRKRALKVFIPFLIWSFIYLAWNGGFADGNFGPLAILKGLERILRGPREAHLWFFYVLIGLYLITPTLRIFTVNASNRDLLYFTVLWFMVNPIFSVIQQYTSIHIGFEFEFLLGYIGIFVLGFYFGRLQLTKPVLIASAVVFVLGFIATFLAIYIGKQQPNYDQFFEGYLSPTVVLMTASSFLLIRAANDWFSGAIARWIVPLSNTSLGIYLLHVLVLDLLDRYVAPIASFLQTGSSIWVMPLVAVAAFGICFGVVFALQKIPILKYSVP